MMLKLIGTTGCHGTCYDYRLGIGLQVGDDEIGYDYILLMPNFYDYRKLMWKSCLSIGK